LIGSLAFFQPPESPLGMPSDIFSLGLCFMYIITGKANFEETLPLPLKPSHLVQEKPDSFYPYLKEQLIRKGMVEITDLVFLMLHCSPQFRPTRQPSFAL
jgi:hypothetical protein